MAGSDARKWLLILGGLFVISLSANAVLVLLSIRHAPQPEPDAYERALNWDQELAVREATQKAGWHVDAKILDTEHPVEREIRLRVLDRDRQPVVLDQGILQIRRPRDSKELQTLTLNQINAGEYSVRALIPQPGLWQLDLDLRRGNERVITSLRSDVH